VAGGFGWDGKAAPMSVCKRAPRPLRLAAAMASISLVALAGCGDDDSSTSTAGEGESSTTTAAPVIDPGAGGHSPPEIDPAAFVALIDNPSLPYPAGASWSYEG